MAFAPHQFGQYTLTARLGRGGMAEVYRARRGGAAGFERTVVVKKILASHHEDPHFVDMFINEAKIAARLTHPNIVQVYELGEQAGEFYIAMEYVKGKDVLRLLRALTQIEGGSHAVPQLVAAYIARETCRGLGHAHDHTDEAGVAKPIIHRDISPQNIMLSYDGQVKLVDFGIAKALDSMKEETRTGALKGKFAYMAPEQIGAHTTLPQSDVFALGVVLHEMLTGLRLFKGLNDYETLANVQHKKVPKPSSLNPEVAAELDAITLHALERDTNLRYARAGQMARDLDAFLQSHHFTVEDMAEYMLQMFPPDSRETELEGHMTSSYNIGSRSEATVPSSPNAIAATPSSVRAAEVSNVPARGRSGTTAVFALLLAGTAALIAWPMLRQRFLPSSPRAPVALPADTPPDRPLEAPAPADIRVESDPSGAQVWRGPKLLGITPLYVHPDASARVTLTLTLPDYDDLSYTLAKDDGPKLTLRLKKQAQPLGPPAHHHDAAKKATVTARPPAPPVEDKAQPHIPKVQPVDE